MPRAPIRVTSCHDWAPGWPWIAELYRGEPEIEWHSISSRRSSFARRIPGPHYGRLRVALQIAALTALRRTDLVVSHGPYLSYYIEALGRRFSHSVPHFAFSFNFTDIPEGYRRNAMRRVFGHIDRFFVFSNMERDLYSRIFEVPIERFIFMRWGVAPPITNPGPRTITSPYVISIGGEARDYKTLCEAAQLIPHAKFVLITRPESLQGINVPANVTVYVNLPWKETWSLVAHADAALVPLRSSQTPNGHVTIVGAMHLGKAQVVTDSTGIRDYVDDGNTGLLVPPKDARAFAAAIERLLDDAAMRNRLGSAAQSFARAKCTEEVTVEVFRTELAQVLG